ncbi:MAG: septum formation inhibitor Maf [Bacteroidota bacterium]
MKKWIKFEVAIVFFACVMVAMESCKENNPVADKEVALNTDIENAPIKTPKKNLSQEFKAYWYAGQAEITSYSLTQPRYGQIREGNAVLIFVTEPFSAEKQVKADNHHSSNIPVLKLNSTKNYLTGIYPYSIMTSSFYPVHDNSHAVKLAFSAQEWCGQVYAQLNNRERLEFMSHSYFESEADQLLEVDQAILENELWNKIRIDPKSLPTGEFEVIPSLEFIRLSHKEFKTYRANGSLTENDGLSSYTLSYPELKRSLKINFTSSFPYSIEGWSETFVSGFGANAKEMTSEAKKLKSIKSPYWQRNSNEYLSLRDSLGL